MNKKLIVSALVSSMIISSISLGVLANSKDDINVDENVIEETQEADAYYSGSSFVAKPAKYHFLPTEKITINYTVDKVNGENIDCYITISNLGSGQNLDYRQIDTSSLPNGKTNGTVTFNALSKGNYDVNYTYVSASSGDHGLTFNFFVDNGEHTLVEGVCSKCGNIPDGLVFVYGAWVYYQDNILVSSFTGMAKKADKSDSRWYYIEKGFWKQDKNGWYQYNNMWYNLQNGVAIATSATDPNQTSTPTPTPTKVTVNPTISDKPSPSIAVHTHSYVNGACSCGSTGNGLCKVNGKWGYYVSGKLQSTKTGIVKKAMSTDAKWYFVKNGIYTTSTGIAKKADGSSATWYFVKNGIYTKASGIALKADGSSNTWFYVLNGIYTKKTGIAKKADGSSSTWYYIFDGIYKKSSGITKKADGSDTKWYYVLNGIYKTNTGIAKKADSTDTKWYFVKSGVFTKATGIARKADGSSTTCFYVKDGIFTKITGKVTVGTKTYTLKAGVVQ